MQRVVALVLSLLVQVLFFSTGINGTKFGGEDHKVCLVLPMRSVILLVPHLVVLMLTLVLLVPS